MRRLPATRALVAAAVVLGGLVAACSDPGSPGPPVGIGSRGSQASETYLGLPVEELEDVTVLDELPLVGFPAASTDPDRLWLGAPEGLAWIDPTDETSHLVDHLPGVYLAVDGDRLFRAAWANGDVALYDISGQPREVARHRAPSPLNIVAGRLGVWAADHDHGNLLRLDPETVEITRRVPIGSGEGLGTAGMVSVGDHLWVVSKRDGRLYEVDGRNGHIRDHVVLGGEPGDDVTRTPAGIWVWILPRDGLDSWLELVDPRSRSVIARVPARDPGVVTEENWGIVSAPVLVGDDVWLPVDDVLVRLSPDNGWQPDRVLGLPVPMTARYAVVAFGSLWITSSLPDPVVVRVDLAALAAP